MSRIEEFQGSLSRYLSTREGAKVKLQIQIGLFVLSAECYFVVFGPLGALAIMALLLIHECGHIWAMHRVGIRLKGIYFIPFLGAAVIPEKQFHCYKAELYTAIMGPTTDLVLTLITFFGYWYTKNITFLAIAVMFVFNDLLNFLPILSLDGGLILKSIAFSLSPKIRFLLVALGFLVTLSICILTIALPIAFTFPFTNISEGTEAVSLSRRIFWVAWLSYVLLMAWAWVQGRAYAKEEKIRKRRMSKVETAFHSVLYLIVVGALLLFVIAGLVTIRLDLP